MALPGIDARVIRREEPAATSDANEHDHPRRPERVSHRNLSAIHTARAIPPPFQRIDGVMRAIDSIT